MVPVAVMQGRKQIFAIHVPQKQLHVYIYMCAKESQSAHPPFCEAGTYTVVVTIYAQLVYNLLTKWKEHVGQADVERVSSHTEIQSTLLQCPL